MSLESEVADLQNRISAADRERIRAEAARDAAVDAAQRARDELKREFGVDSLAEANELLEGLRAELGLIVGKVTAALDKAGIS